MGTSDLYGKYQLKIGDTLCKGYKIGDTVHIPDGVYASFEGFVVIVDHKFVAEFDHIHTKWGGCIFPKEVININRFEKTHVNTKN
jgi:hypothetical protein